MLDEGLFVVPRTYAAPVSHHTNHAPSHQWQPVLNQQWPQRDDKGPHARDIPMRTENTPVQARIHWRTDGWETVTGRVTRRANGCVYVELSDPRMMTSGVWVSVEHVRTVDRNFAETAQG